MSPQECEGRGCCWAPAEFEGAPHVDLPWCFKQNAAPSAYRAIDLQAGAGALGCAGMPTWVHMHARLYLHCRRGSVRSLAPQLNLSALRRPRRPGSAIQECHPPN